MVWQRNYYEHIIRNDKSLEKIRKYIVNNPYNWDKDLENLDYLNQLSKIEKIKQFKFHRKFFLDNK